MSSERTGPLPSEGRLEDRGVARHRKLFERFARCARKRVERVRFAGIPYDVVEERAELSVAELDAGVGDHLDQLFKVQLGRHRHAGPVEQLQSAGFLADLDDPSFQRFIHRKEAGFERLSLGDFEERPAEHGGRFADRHLALAGDPVQPSVGVLHPELGIESAGSACRSETPHESSGRRRRRSRTPSLRTTGLPSGGPARKAGPPVATNSNPWNPDRSRRCRIRSPLPLREAGPPRLAFALRARSRRFSVISSVILPAAQQSLRFGHRAHLGKRNVPRQMVESAGTGDDRLFGRQP